LGVPLLNLLPQNNKMKLQSLFALLVVASPLTAQSTTWTIDPNHTAAQSAVKHMMVSTVRGQFEKVAGTIQMDGNDLKTLAINVNIDAASINTRVDMRDKDLRSANFFDVEKYPTITFVSKKTEAVDATHFKVTGDLTMHGVTKPVVLDVESSPPVKQGQMMRVGASATTKINRHDWDLHYNRMIEGAAVVGDEITITIDVEATKRAG
jgi:polyisoprenoid-binding protein YceI